ncbi:MAG: hypothetical protein R3225_01780 [Halofilum sp. (in: g-proteobacteria)]|nr:hypothetical protein [Halofilum sp. (in: g-proteobacteria)]
MEPDSTPGGRLDAVVLLLVVALALFASPFTTWWATAGLPWYFPFVLWALLIGLVALHHWLERHRDA